MLRREGEAKQLGFVDTARAALSVPEEHVLLRMKRAVDWRAVERELEEYYAAGMGRPSWPPTLLLRMLLLEEWARLSDRDVEEQVGYNLLYRAFVGLGLEDRVPDSTTLVTFRARLGEEGVRRAFETVSRQWEAAGLIGSERRVVDGVHLWARVARRSLVSLLREGRRVVAKAVAEVDPERASALGAYLEAVEGEEGSEALVAAEAVQTESLLACVAEVKDGAVQARVAQVRTLLRGGGDRVVSFNDVDARWGHKSEEVVFCGYKAHEAIDPESRLITAVDVVAGNANEAVQTDALLEKETAELRQGAVVIADGLYNNATTVGQVEKRKLLPCFAGLKAERVSDGFGYDAEADQIVCAEAKRSIGKVRVDNGDLYYFSMSDCSRCPRREQCLSAGERKGKAQPRRRVYLSDVRKRKVVAGEAGREWRREQMRLRGRIEAKFDEQMNRHGLRRARYWGKSKVTVQVLLNAMVVNLKRAVKLLAPPPREAYA